MPNDFIEREILFNTLQLAAKASGAMGRHDSAGIYASAASLVAEQPAADVVPVVHARWVLSESTILCNCSNCGAADPGDEAMNLTNYCPNCGARMDAKEAFNAD